MEIIRFPHRKKWQQIIQRPLLRFEVIREAIIPILQAVRREGDSAIKRYTMLFDKVNIKSLRVSNKEIELAKQQVKESLKRAIKVAYDNIFIFHDSQREQVKMIPTTPGVICWRKSVPIEKVGLYVPGGTSPLFSTVLMLGIPAKIAGCSQVILCTPPDQTGKIHPAILYTSELVGINQIFKVGGAQAIAAMAYGSKTIPAVYKIFGPGNQYVTAAKQLVSQEGVAIDIPAGPSEVLVVADQTADPEFIAADLLSQAEHGSDSQVLLITDDDKLLPAVQAAVDRQLAVLPRFDLANASLESCKLILVHDLVEILDFVNVYAPEHLILMVKDPESIAENVINAGSVFLGKYTPESAGDYASGTNHTLPTNGFAMAYSGVSIDSFVKKITFQHISAKGLKRIGPVIEKMAEAEELMAHKEAVRIRLNQINNKE